MKRTYNEQFRVFSKYFCLIRSSVILKQAKVQLGMKSIIFTIYTLLKLELSVSFKLI